MVGNLCESQAFVLGDQHVFDQVSGLRGHIRLGREVVLQAVDRARVVFTAISALERKDSKEHFYEEDP